MVRATPTLGKESLRRRAGVPAESAPLRRQWLTEDVVRSSGKLRVDRAKGVIYGVKILGLDSANGRRYLPEAVKAAIPLYEGRSVRIDHPLKPDAQRSVRDVFGWFEGVHAGPDGGLYGNLHILNPKTDLAESVFCAAENKPDLMGFSHNAQGEGETINGVFVVQEIVEVRSVDLVADPATTNGLHESRGHKVKIKLKALVEATTKKLDLGKRKAVKKLLEDGAMDPEMEMETSGDLPADSAPPEDHMAALRTGFEGSCMAIITKALDGEMEPKEALKQLKELITTHGKLTGDKGGGGEPVEEEEEDIEEECDPEEKKMKESVELRLLRRERKGRQLCEAADVTPDSVLLEALARLPDEPAMTRLIEREKGRTTATKPSPRSGGGGGGGKKTLVESAGGTGDDISEFMGALRR